MPRSHRGGPAEQPLRYLGHVGVWTEAFAEEIMQNEQRQGAPAHRQVLERCLRTHGRPRLERTVPSRLIEPERKNGPGRTCTIEWCPQGPGHMLKAHETVIVASDNLLNLTLKVENNRTEFHGRETRRRLHPAGEMDVASAATMSDLFIMAKP